MVGVLDEAEALARRDVPPPGRVDGEPAAMAQSSPTASRTSSMIPVAEPGPVLELPPYSSARRLQRGKRNWCGSEPPPVT